MARYTIYRTDGTSETGEIDLRFDADAQEQANKHFGQFLHTTFAHQPQDLDAWSIVPRDVVHNGERTDIFSDVDGHTKGLARNDAATAICHEDIWGDAVLFDHPVFDNNWDVIREERPRYKSVEERQAESRARMEAERQKSPEQQREENRQLTERERREDR